MFFILNSSRTSILIYSRVLICVDSKIIGGATFSLYASIHLDTHRHHLSPSFKPLKLYIGLSFVKSFPLLFENSKNKSVTTAQTVCVPISLIPVLQHPSLNAPVIGLVPQITSGLLYTFRLSFIFL